MAPAVLPVSTSPQVIGKALMQSSFGSGPVLTDHGPLNGDTFPPPQSLMMYTS